VTCAVCSAEDHAILKLDPIRIACECVYIGTQPAYEDIPAMRLYNHTCMSTIAIVIKEAA
jgi:hypothetical protein